MFNIGDTIWFPIYKCNEVQVPCPSCFGKLKVTVVLGNGDEIAVNCETCRSGYGSPRGTVSTWKGDVEVMKGEVTGVDRNTSDYSGTRPYHYRLDCYGYTYGVDSNMAFATKEEAESRAPEIMANHEAEEVARLLATVGAKTATMARQASYFLQEAKRLREDAKRYDELAIIIGNRAKTKPSQ